MNSKKQLYVSLGKVLARNLVVIVFCVTATLMLNAQIKEISANLQTKRSQILRLQTGNDALVNLQETFANIGDGDERIKNALLSQDNIVPFLLHLDSLANGVTVKHNYGNFSNQTIFGAVNGEEGEYIIYSNDFILTVETGIRNLIGYLKSFERLPYFAQITSINIEARPDNQAGWQEISNISTNGKLYVKQ
ncbi:MAG: hypothetical protein COT81_02330 [Candidatus Buchananbacteria bacterium CG10_big_fil_rev_8_21_14_0_10_42_9]|uniref:Uncharacterized protein n=1 Tax=Candidatus Buchananbacteria bacterium CG10_big_fil_rev_8_21_14_0_10_42_9 TaxID=1974526 RepID=A0A2H0W1L5_9BACT|nr:MAG: hypothetical protein COT81_02330 [Candidatus Buchananbacteria bacterium CG10_big_fil_rev_8_21_14_0_10_42_9]